jgi:rsbT co-antagonist protein RsbR
MNLSSAATLLNSIREPAAILDPQGRVHAANPPWAQVSANQALAGDGFGAGCDYLKRCQEVRGDASVEELARGLRELFDAKRETLTMEYACDGAPSPRHFEIVASALPTGDATGALLMHHDITERKELEAAHRATKDRLRYVLDMLPEGFWDWNLVTDEVYYSDLWCETLGYAPSEVEPHARAWVNLLHPDDRTRVLDAMYGYIEGRYPFYSCEARLRRKDGTYRWDIDRGRIVTRDENGKALRVVGLQIDISDRKLAESLVEEQSKRLMDLSTPLIPISEQVVAMPLIGTIDAERADQVLSSLLNGISRSGASVAILDVTGVSLMDSHVAAVLVNAAKGVQLLGAQVVLTGVRPEVASILVKLDLDLTNIVIRGTLQSGIAYATGVEGGRGRA